MPRSQFSTRRWLTAAPLIAAGALEAALGLAQVFNGQDGTGTYVNRDHYAGLLEMTFPFALMQAISIWRGTDTRRDFPIGPALRMCFLLGLSALMLLGIVYSLSRMGFGAALCSLLVMGAAAQSRRGRKWPVPVALLSAGVLAMFVFLPPDRMISRFAPFSSAQGISAESRLELWGESAGVFRDYPLFGCGMGGFESVFPRYKVSDPLAGDAYVHNDYLQLLIELGVVGFVIGVVLFACIGGMAARAAARAPDSDGRCLAIACMGALTAIGIHSFVDFNLYIPANAMLLAWVSGICASLDMF